MARRILLASKSANRRTIVYLQKSGIDVRPLRYMKIEKKVWPEYFQAILDGKKTYELRLADFECKEEDVLVLREWDPKTSEYSGRQIEKTVTYVGKFKKIPFWTKKEIEKYGFQIISFK